MPQMTPFTLSYPMATPSLNELKRMNPHVYKKLRDGYHRWLMFVVNEADRCDPCQRRKVTITRYSPGELDYDNLVGGVKPLVDALRLVGVIEDDKPMWLDLVVRQKKAPRGGGSTEIVVEEAVGAALDKRVAALEGRAGGVIEVWGSVSKKRLGEMVGEALMVNELVTIDGSRITAIGGKKVRR